MFNKCWRRLRSNERGMSMVFISLGFMSFMAATTLAIDVGMFMTARAQAQNAADAGALAGATALAFNSFTDRTATGPAVTGAVNTAQANLVIGQAPSVLPADVTFPVDPATGLSNQVQVTVYRTSDRGNPLSTLIGWVFGVNSADVTATATAGAIAANAENCVLPFTVPDRWQEASGTWTPASTFDPGDIYVPPTSKDPKPTGYTNADVGLEITLKPSNGNNIAPSMYNAWDLPGSVGASDYSANIASCNTNLVKIGDWMAPENGNMVGPTKQGTDTLMMSDSGAQWNDSCKCVKNSAYAPQPSPRIRILPLYDPQVYADGKASGKSNPQLQVVNYAGFFVEDVTGAGAVTGRLMSVTGQFVSSGPISNDGLVKALMFVK
jgi:Flp pilus assembly protein TadG